jgi:sensor domain CHASE-containing protein
LTVADSDGFAQLGIDINLLLDDDGHVRFEICANELRRSGLNVSAQLLRLARPVAEVNP